jgi:hypothetical protein
MFINTPNLYNSDADKSYYDTSVGALSAIQESFEYFSNPQHKLPCVNYTQKILDSDYATLVYNSCQTFEAAKSATSLNYNDSTIIYNYDKNPKIIAYVWDNAKVSRNETYDKNGNAKTVGAMALDALLDDGMSDDPNGSFTAANGMTYAKYRNDGTLSSAYESYIRSGAQSKTVNNTTNNNNNSPVVYSPNILIDGQKITSVVVDGINAITRSSGNSPLVEMGG